VTRTAKNPPAFRVLFFRTANGNEPTREWLRDGISDEARLRIGADLDYVQYHWPVSMPRVRALGGGLHELRSTCGRVEYRIFFFVRGQVIIILHGIVKKTRHIPPSDLAIVEERKKLV
jgi:phage-related protein